MDWRAVVRDALAAGTSLAVVAEDRPRPRLLGEVASLAGKDRTVAVMGVTTLVSTKGSVWTCTPADGKLNREAAIVVHLFGEAAVIVVDAPADEALCDMLQLSTSLGASVVAGCLPEGLASLASADHGWWRRRVDHATATFPWCDLAVVAEGEYPVDCEVRVILRAAGEAVLGAQLTQWEAERCPRLAR